MLDLMAISFLTRFRERPLRFFGMIGLFCIVVGLAMIAYPLFDKFFTPGKGLQDRPIFVAGTILVTFGVQLLGFGLVGEIVIFTHARNMEEYQVDQVLTGRIELPEAISSENGVPDSAGVTVRELLPGEDAKWDAYVRDHPGGTFFHLSGWRKVVEDCFKHEVFYLVAETRGEWLGVLPLFRVKSPFTGNNLISVPYGVYGGPLASNQGATKALLNEAQSQGRSQGVDYVELRAMDEVEAGVPASDLYVTFRQDLPVDPDEILPAVPKKARAEIRRARDKFSLRCEVSEDLQGFYRLFVGNKQRLGSPSLPYRWFRALREEFGSRFVLHMVYEPDDTPIAGVVSFVMNDVVYAYYSGSIHSRNKTGANNFIYFSIMRWAAEQGFKVFDFGRSRQGSGPAAFKKNMGFTPLPLHYQYWMISETAQMPDFNPGNPKLALPRRIWSHLPPLVARGLSGPLSRYLP